MENASDWYLYGMDKDKSYDNVILAVVGNADTDIRNSRGDFISVMPMEVPQNVARRYLMLASDQGQALCHQNVKENCTRLAVITQERESMPKFSANGSSISEAASRLPALCFSTSHIYNFTPPSLGERNWNVVLASLLVMTKSVSVMMSMPRRMS